MSYEDRKEIASLLMEFFNKDADKVKLWLKTPNPLFGGLSPKTMSASGMDSKLLKIIKNQMSGITP